MARILLAWEIGLGLGHVASLLPLARELAKLGHEPILAVRDVVGSWPTLQGCGFPVLPTPVFFARPHFSEVGSRGYADLLAAHGFDDPQALEPIVRAWRQLLEVVRPQLVIAEHSPTLCLAACGIVPVANLGTGFTVPCEVNGKFPPLKDGTTELRPWGQLQRTISHVMRKLGQTPPPVLAQAVLGDLSLPVVVEAIDPYREHRTTPAIGPLTTLQAVAAIPPDPACLVYLPADHPQLKALITGLVDVQMLGMIYVRDATPEVLEWLRETPFEIFTEPLNLADVFPQISVVLHHGGAGISQACLAAGRPQVIAPIFLEQLQTCQSLEALGVALPLTPAQAEESGNTLMRAARSAPLQATAQQQAQLLHTKYASGSMPAVLQACLQLMQAGPTKHPAPALTKPSAAALGAAVISPAIEPQDMVVFFCCDAGYAPMLEVALWSLLANNLAHRMAIHVALDQTAPASGISQQDAARQHSAALAIRARLQSIAAHFGATLECHFISDPTGIPDVPDLGVFTIATYFRLLLPRLIDIKANPHITRVLYLDCDLVVANDLAPLWTMDLAGAVMAAYPEPDNGIATRSALGLTSSHRYFNTGVMLVDLPKWCAENVTERCMSFIDKHPNRIYLLHDQDTLNACLDGRVTDIHLQYNFMPYVTSIQRRPEFSEVAQSQNLPGIVHYGGPYKPWKPNPPQDRWCGLFFENQRALHAALGAPTPPAA